MRWLEKFKRAAIEKDYETISVMIEQMPQFENLEEQKMALALIKEVKEDVKEEKDEVLSQMQKIQKTKKFLKKEDGVYSFDMSF